MPLGALALRQEKIAATAGRQVVDEGFGSLSADDPVGAVCRQDHWRPGRRSQIYKQRVRVIADVVRAEVRRKSFQPVDGTVFADVVFLGHLRREAVGPASLHRRRRATPRAGHARDIAC